jgi:hypothetical protein
MCNCDAQTCCDNVNCERAYYVKACGHVVGQECFLRCLEKRPFCPICIHVPFDSDEILAMSIEDLNETAIGMALLRDRQRYSQRILGSAVRAMSY